MKMIGSMFVEVNGDDGYHGVVEIAMMENDQGEIQPGGVRDATRPGAPERLPELDEVRAAMELAKWCYYNQSVFEGRVSREPGNVWEIATDLCINDVLREESSEDDFDPESN